MELSIDTSTNFAGIALSDQGIVLTEHIWRSERNHTRELVPQIQNLLNQRQIDIKGINAIFVAKGPGSFNGLRVGISTAKGLAFALKIPIISISTMEIEAYPFAFTGLQICPIHNAGRGEIAVAFYRQNDSWHCLKTEYLTTPDQLCLSIRKKTIFCGEIPETVLPILRERLDSKAIIPELSARQRRAGFLASLGWLRLQKGEQDDQYTLQPIYMRQPPITPRKEKIIKK